MRYYRPRLLIALLLGSFLLPSSTLAAIPFLGPIIPNAQQLCPGSFFLVIVVINNIISLSITLAIVFVAPIMLAYSGFLLVTNAFNPSAKEDAKKMITNTIVGIVIALAAWMIVDALMAVLYHPTDPALAGKTWSELITGSTGGDACLKIAASLHQNKTGLGITGSTPDDRGVYVDGKTAALCADSNTACSPAALQAAGLSSKQANVMSCIAITESSGVASTPPYNVAHPGSNSTACGLFQITKTTWNSSASGACTDFSNCTNAACNVQVAKTLVSKNGYSDWTCPNCNSKAQACIDQYDSRI